MIDLTPQPGDLDPIETAPVEELRALQLERLQWSVRHAYDHVAHYRRRLRRGRRGTRRRTVAGGPGEAAVHHQGRPARQLPLRHVRGPARGRRTPARLQRDDRQADRRRLHRATTSTCGPTWWRGRSAPRAAGAGWCCTTPTATGSSPAASARTTGPSGSGCTVVPVSGGMTRAPGAADPGLRARHHHGDAVLHALDPRRARARRASTRARPRSRSASSAPSRGPTTCAARWSSAPTCTRSTSTACPR